MSLFGKVNNPEGKNQYSNGGGAKRDMGKFNSLKRLRSLRESTAGGGRGDSGYFTPSDVKGGRGNINPMNVTANKVIPGLSYEQGNAGGRGNKVPLELMVDPYKRAGMRGANIGAKAERIAAISKGAAKGLGEGVRSAKSATNVKDAISNVASSVKRGAMNAELNFAETSTGRGAARGEAIARKAASAADSARMTAMSVADTAREKAKQASASASATMQKIKSRMWG